MKIALIGASGFVGKALTRELLDRHHSVTAIARNPEQLAAVAGNGGAGKLVLAKGDVFNPSELAELLKGHDAVVSAYNPGWTNPKIYSEFIAGSKSIVEAVKKAGVKRLIVIGGAGSLFVAPGVQLVDTPQFPAEYKEGASGARDFLNELKKEDSLDWTFFSPAILMHPGTSGVRKGHYRTALENPVFDEKGQSILSVEDVAVAIADELENSKHVKQRFTAAY